MLKIAICDDDIEMVNYLSNLISQNFLVEHALTLHNNTFSLLTYIEDTVKGNIDILIIDIELNQENGIEVAERLKIIYPHIKIIFMTGFIDYAEDIFDVEPVYFIVKPISLERVLSALNKAKDIIEEEKKQIISIVNRNGVINIKVSSIRYLESRKRTLYIYETNIIRDVQMKLDEMQGKLPNYFLRCHQSFLVNMERIKIFNSNGIVLRSGEMIPVSRPKYNDAKRIFLKYLGEKL